MDFYNDEDFLSYHSKSEFLNDRLILYAVQIDIGIEKDAKKHFRLYLDEMLTQSRTDNYYWSFCPLMVYQNHFEDRLNEYLSANPGKDAMHFIEKCKAEILLYYEPQMKVNYASGTEVELRKENIRFVYFDGTGLGDAKYQPVYIDLSFIDEVTIQILCYNEREKLTFLDSELRKLNTPPKNQHPTIFVNADSFTLFKKLLETIGTKHADVSFIYRIMHEDELIHQASEGIFREWLKTKMNISFGNLKLQQLYRTETDQKKRLYLHVLDQFQLKSKTYS